MQIPDPVRCYGLAEQCSGAGREDRFTRRNDEPIDLRAAAIRIECPITTAPAPTGNCRRFSFGALRTAADRLAARLSKLLPKIADVRRP